MAQVSYPPAGSSPLGPHGAIIGPTRVATPVFGPGGTPQMYRSRFPARGPVCDYCDPNYYTVASGGQDVIPYQQQQLGDAVDFLRKQNPVVAGLLVLGGSLLTGTVLSLGAVWLYKKAGGTTHEAEAEATEFGMDFARGSRSSRRRRNRYARSYAR
jgi:hypothetical protein